MQTDTILAGSVLTTAAQSPTLDAVSRSGRSRGAGQSPTLIDNSPIHQVLNIARRERRGAYTDAAWVGHQIQLVKTERVAIESDGRHYEVGPGTALWFYEGESVQGRVLATPCVLYAINFLAPTLPPPNFEDRFLHPLGKKIIGQVEELSQVWRDATPLRPFRVQARLLTLLAELATPGQRAARVDREAGLWWHVETALRRDLRRPMDLTGMSQLVKRTSVAITRSCQRAVGLSPLKRLKQLRMSLARSLVQRSPLRFTAIAERVGYARVHEFSRDYHKHFDATPTRDRGTWERRPRRDSAGPVAAGTPLPPPASEARPVVEASPIEHVIFLNRLEMKEEGFQCSEPSFPGHHFQLSVSGRMQVETCGRRFEVGPGGLLWFHNDEEFEYRLLEAPRVFYVLNFIAPTLSPPAYEARCLTLPKKRIIARFNSLLRTWQDTATPSLVRLLRVHAGLLHLLDDVITHIQATVPLDQDVALWWQIEHELRKDWTRPISVRWMSQLVGRSPATITRACRRAVGRPPLDRVRQIRLNMARGLIWMSTLSMSEIAGRLGYPRVQELSRDYSHQWRVTPTEDRRRFPEIYERVFGMPYTLPSETR